MECDKQGHVLWMNQRARLRLGPVSSLYEALPAPQLTQVAQFLRADVHGVLISSFTSGERRVPVHLVRLLALEDRVVVSAEVRARASDQLPPQNEILGILLRMQSNATRN